MLKVEKITKKFGKAVAVNAVTFQCEAGEIVGFLGPNGAGKTTTMRLITGFFEADEGTITIDGFDIKKNPLSAKSRIGYLPEDAPIYPQMTLEQYLNFLGGIRQIEKHELPRRIEYVLEACELKDRRNSRLGELSRGLRQRAELSGALLHDPAVLILDEPTSGMDPYQRQQFRELMQYWGQEKTILYSTHILSEVADICQRLVVINQGVLVASGTPDELSGLVSGNDSCIMVVLRGENIKSQLSLLDGLLGIDKITPTDQEKESGQERYSLLVKPEQARQLMAAVGRLAKEAFWIVHELSLQTVNLEETFVYLTRKINSHNTIL